MFIEISCPLVLLIPAPTVAAMRTQTPFGSDTHDCKLNDTPRTRSNPEKSAERRENRNGDDPRIAARSIAEASA